MTSSYAYERTPDRWVSQNGEFPGDIEEGTFPGVKPNDPDGTSWMIGMHRDGEETVGRWATAPHRAGLAQKQQLAQRGTANDFRGSPELGARLEASLDERPESAHALARSVADAQRPEPP